MTRTPVSGMPKKSDHTRKDTQEIHETCCSGKPLRSLNSPQD